MCQRSESFPNNAIFMRFGLQRFCSMSRRLVGFHHTTLHCFELLLMANFLLCIGFHDAGLLSVSLAGHGWSHRSFQFSSCVFDNFWILFVIGIDEVNPSQLSSIVKLQLVSLSPIPASLDSGRLYQFSSSLLAIHDLDWQSFRLNHCQSPPGPHVSLWKLLYQWSEFRKSFPGVWQMLAWIDIPAIASIFFSCMTSRSVWVDPVTSMYFRGMENASSFGT